MHTIISQDNNLNGHLMPPGFEFLTLFLIFNLKGMSNVECILSFSSN
jgi:hypothetical protein